MRFFLLSVFLFLGVVVYGQPDYIRTVECYPEGRPFDEPVIGMGERTRLLFSFDDLSEDTRTYTYRIEHCDPEWHPSGLGFFVFAEGFVSNPLDEPEYSFNTVVPYAHFTLTLPNENVRMKLSGNYLLRIFDDERRDTPVIEQRFSVVDPKVMIRANVTTSTLPQYLKTSQQLNFAVRYDNLPIHNPVRDVKVCVTQNQDPRTTRFFVPTFVRDGQLIYGDGHNNLFDGLAPFRTFQCASIVYYTQYVKSVLTDSAGVVHFILQPGSPYADFVPQPNLHGNYSVEAENTNDAAVEADYVTVHFAVLCPEPIPQADVYVYGKFTGWRLDPAFRMEYDARHGAYVGEVPVKQGNYDYRFAVVPRGTGIPDLTRLQGNFYRNPNDYSVRCYFYNYTRHYYELVGYQPVPFAGVGF